VRGLRGGDKGEERQEATRRRLLRVREQSVCAPCHQAVRAHRTRIVQDGAPILLHSRHRGTNRAERGGGGEEAERSVSHRSC